MVAKAIAASKDWSWNGRLSAAAAMHGAAPAGRCARMTADGSAAVTSRPGGSYEPVPAPTFSTVRASPSAAQTCAAILGSVRRVAGYAPPMASYSRAEHSQLFLWCHCYSLRPCLQFPVDGRSHRICAVALLQQQASQPA